MTNAEIIIWGLLVYSIISLIVCGIALTDFTGDSPKDGMRVAVWSFFWPFGAMILFGIWIGKMLQNK